MRCMFCAHDGALTAEHVFPAWAKSYLDDPDGGAGTHRRTTIRLEEPEDQQREYKGRAAELTVRSVCARCNNGWMSQLEGDAQPFLATMIRGHGRTYCERGMTTIATWFVKTALVAGSRFPPLLSSSFYEQIRSDLRPSPTTRVWLASTPYWQQHYVDYRPMRVHADDTLPPPVPNAYSAVIALGGLAGYVVSWSERMPDTTAAQRRFAPALLPIWPLPGDEATWPPRGGPLTFDQMDDLADAICSADDIRDRRGR